MNEQVIEITMKNLGTKDERSFIVHVYEGSGRKILDELSGVVLLLDGIVMDSHIQTVIERKR